MGTSLTSIRNATSTRFRRTLLAAGAAAVLTSLLSLSFPGMALAGNTSWPQDTDLVVNGITLKILATSQSDSLVVNATNFVVTVAAAETFKVRYPGPNPGSFTITGTGAPAGCNNVSGNNDITVTGAGNALTFTPQSGTPCGVAGGGGSSTTPTATMSQPNGGETLAAGTSYQVFWGAGGTGVQTMRLSLSTDGGTTYATVADNEFNDGFYTWTVPSTATTQGRMKVEAIGTGGSVLASDSSNADFTITVPSSGGGGGGGGATTPPPTTTTPTTTPTTTEDTSATLKVKVLSPNGGESYPGGSSLTMRWDIAGDSGMGALVSKPSLSTDGGATWVALATSVTAPMFTFTLPTTVTSTARVRVDVTDTAGGMATDMSDKDFLITAVGSVTIVPTYPSGTFDPVGLTDEEIKAPDADPNATSGSYSAGTALTSTPTIDVDKNIVPPPPDTKLPCTGGSLLKLQQASSIYYCAKNGRRFVFPTGAIYLTWYKDFKSVVTISEASMAKIPIGGNITYKPGVRMIKITTDPKVYAIARDGLLRWVKDETVAVKLYGPDWNKKIDDVPDSFFFNYKIGEPITDGVGTAESTAPVTATSTSTSTTSTSQTSQACSSSTTFTEFLNVGTTHAQVTALQDLLKCLGYLPATLASTGYYGIQTFEAVKNLQSAHQLDAFGYVGPGTREALNTKY